MNVEKGVAAGCSSTVVDLEAVSKRYGRVRALQHVSLTVQAGERVALFGDNGAGKSTLLRLLAAAARADEGEIKLFSLPLTDYYSRSSKIRQSHSIGYQAGAAFFYSHLSVRENLHLYASLRGLSDPGQAVQLEMDRFSITHFAGKRISECSQGMARRAMLARAFLGQPSLLLLDEPTLGLDRSSCEALVRAVFSLLQLKPGTAVLFASHDERFIERLATRVIELKEGRIVKDSESVLNSVLPLAARAD
ncbi:MAG: ABC transporter ATP-binding protein [bacterium]|nr:ABC transporter ATP-binding protein [bacterium]